MKKPKKKKKPRSNRHRKYVYTPNVISMKTRIYCFLSVVFLMGYGIAGYVTNSMYVPGRRGRGVTIEDEAIIVMIVALVLASIGLLSEVVDHYDNRDNEQQYAKFQFIVFCSAVGLAFFSLVVNLVI